MNTSSHNLWLYLLGGILFCSAILYPTLTHAHPLQFIDGIWLSHTELYPEKSVRVYVALRNTAGSDISGTLSLEVDDISVGSTTVTALPNRLIESWVDWTPTQPGSYTLTAKLHDIVVHNTTNATSSTPMELTLQHVQVLAPITPNATSSQINPTDNSNSLFTHLLHATTTRAGAEQFIPESKPREWVQTTTNTIHETHDWLDNYQEKLVSKRSLSRATSSPAQTGTTTIGQMITKPATTWLANNFTNAHIGVVTALQWLFSYPALIQFIFLLGILSAAYRTARYFGKRRKS